MWSSHFDVERLAEINEFAKKRSTPMFESFIGCLGHLFAHQGDRYMATSLWIGRHAIAIAEASQVYKETADALAQTGLLRCGQTVDVYDIVALNMGFEDRKDQVD
jgi:hypothetical protein